MEGFSAEIVKDYDTPSIHGDYSINPDMQPAFDRWYEIKSLTLSLKSVCLGVVVSYLFYTINV